MGQSKVDHEQLMDGLVAVFQTYGYEGASLTRLTQTTGLKRASLYHHFSGGKNEMALAALNHVSQWFVTHIFEPLAQPGDPVQRVKAMARQLDKFYDKGSRSCLLDTLSLGDETQDLQSHVKQATLAWIMVMAQVVQESGLAANEARQRAETAFIQIEGALVLARSTGDRKPFRKVLNQLPILLLE
ncbi:MAG: TetR/AcrR family transcriptional regulator [Cyanobacteria bacterium J06635_1]